MNNLVEMQKDVIDMLQKNYKNNRLSHAYIFYGEDGVGKEEVALYFTALLYSKDGVVDYSSPTTKAIYAHEFPNLYEVRVRERRTEIIVDDIEALLDEFSKTSLVEGPRVFIIHEADKLNQKTSNMLLKFIEEPEGEDVHGIFITSNPSNILPTIVSRCNLVGFKSMDKNILFDMIKSTGIEAPDAEILKELTNNTSDAIDLVDSDSYNISKDMVMKFLSINKEAAMLLEINSSREIYDNTNMKQFLEMLSLFLEDMLYEEPIKFKLYKKEIKRFKESHDDADIRAKLEMVLEYIRMLTSHVNSRNILFDLIASWYR